MATATRPAYGTRISVDPLEGSKEFYLFFLEFYVKQVSSDRLGILNDILSAPTRVCLKIDRFVNDDGLEVTPVDLVFQPQAGFATSVEIFNVGISMLTAFRFGTESRSTMILKIIVEKWLPDIDVGPFLDCLVGVGQLDMSDVYDALQKEMLQCWRKGVTRSKKFDGQIPLIAGGEQSGTLDIFVRISSSGQMIITDFNAPVPQDSRMFIFGRENVDESYSMHKFHEVNTHTVDNLFEDFSKDVQCPVCLPERYPCVPCGKMGAVQKRDESVAEVKRKGIL